MKFIQCKTPTEKLDAIKQYCNEQISENNRNIQWFKTHQISRLDYADEIHELEISNKRFEKILEIIEANECTDVLIM